MKPPSSSRLSGSTAAGSAEPTGGALDPSQVDAIVRVLGAPGATLWRTQRGAARHAVLNQALIWRIGDDADSEPLRAQLANLSTTGIGLLIGMPLSPTERLTFEMTLEEIGHVQWKCRVRWCEASSDGIYRVGARFIDIAP